MRMLLLLVATLVVSACGSPFACSPACNAGELCCDEPNHNPDAGLHSYRCVATSGPVCPALP